MAYFSKGNLGYSLLHGLRRLAPYWTLHGGGALIYHLNHRLPNDLDFFCEAERWDEFAASFTAAIISPDLPDAEILRARAEKSLHEPHGFFKLHFEKITLAFLKTPILTGTLDRIYPHGLLLLRYGNQIDKIRRLVPVVQSHHLGADRIAQEGRIPHFCRFRRLLTLVSSENIQNTEQ